VLLPFALEAKFSPSTDVLTGERVHIHCEAERALSSSAFLRIILSRRRSPAVQFHWAPPAERPAPYHYPAKLALSTSQYIRILVDWDHITTAGQLPSARRPPELCATETSPLILPSTTTHRNIRYTTILSTTDSSIHPHNGGYALSRPLTSPASPSIATGAISQPRCSGSERDRASTDSSLPPFATPVRFQLARRDVRPPVELPPVNLYGIIVPSAPLGAGYSQASFPASRRSALLARE
jgi:hypothetical protein